MTSGVTLFLVICVVLIMVGVMLANRLSRLRAGTDKKNRRVIPSDEMLDYAERAVEREDYDLALDLCEQIFEQPQAYEDYPAVLSLRIELLIKLHRYDEALDDIQRLKRLDPDNIDELSNMIELAPDTPEEFVNEARKIVAVME